VFADTVPFPSNPYPAKPVVDLHLAPGSAAIDQGVVLVGLNDGFAGAAPDLGAYELGATPPVYGPRTAGTGGSGGASGAAGASGGGGASDAGGSTGNGGQGGTGGILVGTGSDSPDARAATGKAAGGCGCSHSGGGGGAASLALIVLMLAVGRARRARPGTGTWAGVLVLRVGLVERSRFDWVHAHRHGPPIGHCRGNGKSSRAASRAGCAKRRIDCVGLIAAPPGRGARSGPRGRSGLREAFRPA
jgi:MYXO-CTERM domain-containing protein